jgi:hypothetical protein
LLLQLQRIQGQRDVRLRYDAVSLWLVADRIASCEKQPHARMTGNGSLGFSFRRIGTIIVIDANERDADACRVWRTTKHVGENRTDRFIVSAATSGLRRLAVEAPGSCLEPVRIMFPSAPITLGVQPVA